MATVLQEVPTNLGADETAPAPVKGGKQKSKTSHKVLKHREHVLLRPDTYVGSTEQSEAQMWVFDTELSKMEYRQVSYAPALYKIFDEIIVNSADHKQRDDTMKTLKVTIDKEEGSISVFNDGNGIPIKESEQPDEKTGKNLWVPEMIFGVLLSGSNYNDDEERLGGGRNGYGAKLTNIFSSSFTLETCFIDSEEGTAKMYKQTWTNNMADKGKPKITKAKGKKPKGYTKITFIPDFEKFSMTGLDKDIVGLLKKRAYDMAGTTPKDVKVFLNDEEIKIKDFKSYCDMYMPKAEELELTGGQKKAVMFEKVNERWEVGICESADEIEQQVSFVNSIATTTGGTHVRMVQRLVSDHLHAFLKKKHKKEVKVSQIKKNLWVFVKALIVNPTFGSQTKEELKTKESEFEGKKKKGKKADFSCTLSEKFLKKLEKSDIVAAVLSSANAKEERAMRRKGGKKSHKVVIPKLEDANNAGRGKKASKCTLILTEGDSAKSLAMAGLAVVGRDNYGVFPLKGKLLNVRDASNQQIIKNAEVQNIMKIMGLRIGTKYEDVSKLRYGHLMIMTDQDHDGSHIKGLIINFIHKFWPSLLKIPDFLQVFVTPIIKASKGKKQKKIFYTIPEYEEWRETLSDQGRSWKIKYYKGLGTSTSAEAKEYFKGLQEHKLEMLWTGDAENNLVDMCFNSKRANDRKQWILSHDKGGFANFNADAMSITEFIKKELVLFSIADNERSLPSVVDGFKNSQRKVLFAALKRNLVHEIRVAQLAGYTSEHAAYHHGEASLNGTIVGMAQTYVGSNNMNMLYPGGQFGTRFQGGNDAASPRYIHTQLSELARLVFHPDDDALLNYLDDDGVSIEPDYYCPIIPMILVNGASGIGTGWSCKIPNFNPRDIVENLRNLIASETPCMEEMNPMLPWYHGFEGTIEREFHKKKGFEGRYTVRGCAERLDEKTIRITELPIGTWTENYKNFLYDEKNFPDGFLDDIKENHTDTTVEFEITFSEKAAEEMKDDQALFKKFNLQSTLNVTNMTCFDQNAKIRTFASPEEILFEFFNFRLNVYSERKEHIMKRLTREFTVLDNKVRFIEAVISGDLVISNRPKKELMKELRNQGYPAMPSKSKKSEDDEDSYDDIGAKDYDYLLSMPLWNLTMEKVDKLKKQKRVKEDELEDLRATSISDIWLRDLDALETGLDNFDAEMEEGSKRRKQSNEVVGQKIVLYNTAGGNYVAKRSKTVDVVTADESFTAAAPPAPESIIAPSPPKVIASFSANVDMSDSPSPVKKRKAAPKKKTKAKKVVTKVSKKKPAPKPKSESPAGIAPKKTSAILSMTFSDSESDEEFGSLLSRIRARKAGKEKPKYSFDSDEDEEEEISARLSATLTVTKTASTQGEPAKKTRRVTKKKPIVLSSDDEDDWSPSEQDDDDDSDFEL